jgi:hypothetical protein
VFGLNATQTIDAKSSAQIYHLEQIKMREKFSARSRPKMLASGYNLREMSFDEIVWIAKRHVG